MTRVCITQWLSGDPCFSHPCFSMTTKMKLVDISHHKVNELMNVGFVSMCIEGVMHVRKINE